MPWEGSGSEINLDVTAKLGHMTPTPVLVLKNLMRNSLVQKVSH